ncbi:hypothetical protein ACLQ2R_03050 [Streptosporangium sp. DT93]|uniref:hypothetical protein n=1 Tax=Streptosporangium sp. DT93 TaxID=3393428 RepID=UPI003CE9D63B
MITPAHPTNETAGTPPLTDEDWKMLLQERFKRWRIWRSDGGERPGAWYGTQPGHTECADHPWELGAKLDQDEQRRAAG